MKKIFEENMREDYRTHEENETDFKNGFSIIKVVQCNILKVQL